MQLEFAQSSMSPSFARKAAVYLALFLAFPAVLFAQTNYYGTNGTEYAIVGQLPGDQVHPDVALNSSGGFIVWQDNATDGSGWGISARRLDGTLSGTTWDQRVNIQGTNDQENAHVAMLKNGGAVFVWQGGAASRQHIYARFLTPTNVVSGGNLVTNYIWLNPDATSDFAVSTFTNTGSFQADPAVAVLADGNVVVVWQSFDQVGSSSLLDVYGQILSTNGTKISGEFLVNQFTTYNQRNPAVTALANGGFVVAWVSEQERSIAPDWGTNDAYYGVSGIARPSVDVYARLYDAGGEAQGNEFLVNADSNPATDPSVAATSDGNYIVTWSAKDLADAANSWDVYARTFDNVVGGVVERINSHISGDQYAPRISVIGGDYLIVWTSLGQDGSREGVFGQFVHKDGSMVGREFQINTSWISQQIQPAVASDNLNQFLVVWSGFTFGPNSFDLAAQRYLNVAALLPPIDAVYVWAPFTLSDGAYQPQLMVSWSALEGISISNYEIYADGSETPIAVTTDNVWTMTAADGLTTNSTHSFTVDYVTAEGVHSPMSPSASATTWSGGNWGGIPWEWMTTHYGDLSVDFDHNPPTYSWPSPNAPVDQGGPTLLQVFQTGGNPTNSVTWLQQKLTQTRQGLFLSWNTQPGHTYQAQATTNLVSWSNVGEPRLAAGTTDSLNVGGKSAGFYRVLFLY